MLCGRWTGRHAQFNRACGRHPRSNWVCQLLQGEVLRVEVVDAHVTVLAAAGERAPDTDAAGAAAPCQTRAADRWRGGSLAQTERGNVREKQREREREREKEEGDGGEERVKDADRQKDGRTHTHTFTDTDKLAS